MADAALANELKDLINQFEISKAELNSLLEGVTEEQFNKRPPSGGWSIAECVDHLIVTGKDYQRQIENGFKKAEKKNLLLKGPFKISWIGKTFIRNVEPPVKRKLKNPARWTPIRTFTAKS
jgi:hypothetical protein